MRPSQHMVSLEGEPYGYTLKSKSRPGPEEPPGVWVASRVVAVLGWSVRLPTRLGPMFQFLQALPEHRSISPAEFPDGVPSPVESGTLDSQGTDPFLLVFLSPAGEYSLEAALGHVGMREGVLDSLVVCLPLQGGLFPDDLG